MLQRKHDWLVQLRGVITLYRRQEFVYGHHDCALFLARSVDAMTGSAFAAELTPLYSDARGAVRFLKAEGGLEAAITRRLGSPVYGPALRRGDGAFIDRHSVGVCVGMHVLVLTDSGLRPCELRTAVKHWRVG
jgi:hypothetical protein